MVRTTRQRKAHVARQFNTSEKDIARTFGPEHAIGVDTTHSPGFDNWLAEWNQQFELQQRRHLGHQARETNPSRLAQSKAWYSRWKARMDHAKADMEANPWYWEQEQHKRTRITQDLNSSFDPQQATSAPFSASYPPDKGPDTSSTAKEETKQEAHQQRGKALQALRFLPHLLPVFPISVTSISHRATLQPGQS